MPDTLQWPPASGQPEQLMLLLHGWGASAADMTPLALALQAAFPQAALLAPQGFEPVDSGLAGRQWFSLAGITEDSMLRMGETAADESIRILDNRLPVNFCNPEVESRYRARFPA